MKATIVSNKGKFIIDDANIILLPDQSLVLCYPVPNLNGSTDYHIGDISVSNGCFFESKSSISYQELSVLMETANCKKVELNDITVFLLNDVLEKKSAYKYYIDYLKNQISYNKEKISRIDDIRNSYVRTIATAHEDNGDLVLILYTYGNDTVEAIKFKDEEQDNYLFIKDLKRVHTVRKHNTTLLKYAAELVSNKKPGELEIYSDKDGKEYCIDYIVINYIVQKTTYIEESYKTRNILSDDYIYLSKINKEKKLKYKYHYKKDKSLFIGFNSNIRLDSKADDKQLLELYKNSFYKNINE